MNSKKTKYLIVSPVKNEELYVEKTLLSVVNQTLTPSLWLIIDDGSTDRTQEIIEKYSKEYDFIKIDVSRTSGERKLAFAEVMAFNYGYQRVKENNFDYIVKLDCDLSFGKNYFNDLINEFEKDKTLGIASGVYYEKKNSEWDEVVMPYYHAAGASKVIRKNCFIDIGGFIPAPGWDTVDEIKAMYRGWKTRHFRHIQMKHLKPEGSSIGAFRNSVMQGKAYFMSGGSLTFFVIKVAKRLIDSFDIASCIGHFIGYMKAVVRNTEKLVTMEEERLYRRLLKGRLRNIFK